MGVDCITYFKCDVNFDDFPVAIGRLLGVPMIPTVTIGRSQLYIAEGIILDPSHWETRWYSKTSYGLGEIKIDLPSDHWAKKAQLSPFWRLNSRDTIKHEPAIYLSWRSTPLRIAISMNLAMFFGGTVIWSDFDKDKNHVVLERTCTTDEWGLIPYDGDAWHEYHAQLYAIKPLTLEDVEQYRGFAAYGEAEL